MQKIFPLGFPHVYEYDGHLIKYISTYEINQGGPEVGNILIDNKNLFSRYYFGGPLLFDSHFIYAPVLFQSFLNSGFKVAEINLDNNELKILGIKEKLILIEKIENSFLYYYTDLNNEKKKELQI